MTTHDLPDALAEVLHYFALYHVLPSERQAVSRALQFAEDYAVARGYVELGELTAEGRTWLDEWGKETLTILPF